MTASAVPRTEALRSKIQAHAELNAFTSLADDMADSGPLVAVKDMIDVRGMTTTNGSPADHLRPAEEDARAIEGLRRAGVTFVGKTNLYEWGYGVSSANDHYGTVPNPRSPERSAGGSSSGSAAAVAAGLCDWALGTDTAGSTRIPAALCGIVGFKPSRGLIDTTGVTPLSPTQDTLGILAPSIWDAKTAFGLLTKNRPPDSNETRSSEGPRLTIPAGWVRDLDEETAGAWERFADLPETFVCDRDALCEASILVQAYEGARIHAAALEREPDRFGPAVTERLQAGIRLSDDEYRAARRELISLAAAVDSVLHDWDALIMPTAAVIAPLLSAPEAREPLTRFTRPFSGTGNPALSMPAPTAGLPVGIQLVGRTGRDDALLRTATRLQGTLSEVGERHR